MRCCNRRQTSPDNPLVLGVPDGSPVRWVQALVALPGLPAQQWGWVTGSDVAAHLEAKNVQESP